MNRTAQVNLVPFLNEFGSGVSAQFDGTPEYLNVQMSNAIVRAHWTTRLSGGDVSRLLPEIAPEHSSVEITSPDREVECNVSGVSGAVRSIDTSKIIRVSCLTGPEDPVAGGLLLVWRVRNSRSVPPHQLGIIAHYTRITLARTLIPRTATESVQSRRGLFDRMLGELSRAS